MRQVLVVVDDFYDDFAAVRARAIAASYEDEPSGNYPGRNSRAPYITEEATRKLTSLVGGRFAHLADSGSGCFRSTQAGERGTFDVHVDRARLSAVVFLGDGDDACERVGTRFWRHTATGRVGFPQQASAEEYARLSDEILIPDSNRPERWQLTLEARMAPNRLIMFPSKLFHSPGESYGASIASGRLIQMFFLMPL